MRFERLHGVVTYTLVGVGFLVLLLSGELSAVFWAVLGPLVVASAIWGGGPRAGSPLLWNTVLLLALGGLVAVAVTTGDWLRYAIHFASLMLVAKLFQRRTGGDYFQIYVLSFLQLVAGAVINPALSFALCFLLYVVLLTWGLVLLHLRRDVERLSRQPAGGEDATRTLASPRMRRLVTPGFLAGTSALALGIFASSIVVFLLFPRLGLGFFGQHRTTGTQVSGFAEAIELGGFGRLKEDQTIVMRVEIEGVDTQAALPLRMKGIAFDRYDGRGWSKSRRRQRPVRGADDEGYRRLRRRRTQVPPDAVEVVQRVFMENIEVGRKTIFGEPVILGVRDLRDDRFVFDHRQRTHFFVDAHGDVVFHSRSESPLRYGVKSARVPRDPARLRAAGEPRRERVEEYLQLPPLDRRIYDLVERVTRGQTTDYDKVAAIERHLLGSYTYSLEGGHDAEDPLADFLFGKRAGHCEFFSTAFVVLARAAGVPARPVGGFYGGVYNPTGDYVAMRQADAHSWAEVYFPGYGWVTFDATPPSGALVAADEGFFARIGRTIDSLQLLWYKWVIRWDLEQQLDFLRRMGEKVKGLGDFLPDSRSGAGGFLQGVRDAISVRSVLTVFALLLIPLLWVFRARLLSLLPSRRAPSRQRSTHDTREARRFYERLLRAAERRGVEVTPSLTPRRLMARLRDRSPAAAEQAAPVVDLYEAVVFGGRSLSPDAARRCRHHLKNLRRAV